MPTITKFVPYFNWLASSDLDSSRNMVRIIGTWFRIVIHITLTIKMSDWQELMHNSITDNPLLCRHWFRVQHTTDYTVETLYSTIYLSKYFIELNNDKSTQYVALWTHKIHPYLALSGELWSVFYEYFNRNWSCYKGFLLYFHGPLTRYVKLQVAHAQGMPGTFSPAADFKGNC